MRSWLSLLVLLLPQAARASGNCEGTAVHYALSGVAAPAALVAFDVTVPWCGPQGDDGDVKVVLVTDLELGARRWFGSPARGPERQAVLALVGKEKLDPAAAWRAFEKARGFRPLAPAGSCPVEPVVLEGLEGLAGARVVPWGKAEAKDSFEMHRLGLRIGGRDDAVVEAGTHPHGGEPPGVWVVTLPRGPRAYLATARCAGGPPPHMYGPDDPGTCYGAWSLSFKDLPPGPGCAGGTP